MPIQASQMHIFLIWSAIPQTRASPSRGHHCHPAASSRDVRCARMERDTSPSMHSASRRVLATVPTSLIRASCPETALTLVPSSSRPLCGKVIQLSPGSQRVLKKEGGREGKKKNPTTTKKPALARIIFFYGFLRPAAGESLSRFCAVSPVNK